MSGSGYDGQYMVLAFVALILLTLTACSDRAPVPADATPPVAAPSPVAPLPAAVNGWREYPLRDGVISIQPGKWRTDTIEIPVRAGEGLEYKLTVKKGEALVYHISYGTLSEPGMMLSEFHGHTPQVDGVGDLMFYSRTGGSPQSGVFTAPWDGIHGWYLKNDSPKDVVVKIELAGFYALDAV